MKSDACFEDCLEEKAIQLTVNRVKKRSETVNCQTLFDEKAFNNYNTARVGVEQNTMEKML